MTNELEHPVTDTARPSVRLRTALCLSGGGFRASLFHLGALRRLNELGILARVTTICSVSGGSIIAAHLARVVHELGTWPIPGSEWDKRIRSPFFEFTARDIRTRFILRKFLPWNLILPRRLVRWLEQSYESGLTKGMKLADLPTHPEFWFCATDLGFGDTWIFSRGRAANLAGDRRYGGDIAALPVARAVAASSCFPPLFGPLKLDVEIGDASGSLDRPGTRTLGSRPRPFPEVWKKTSTLLNDGGVRDNMGLDPVFTTHQYVIVSDGGSPFRFSGQRIFRPWLGRTLAVVQHQASAVRKSWLLSELQREKPTLRGTYWGIATGENVEESQPQWLPDPAYSRKLAEQQLSRIRTDLNAFSRAEREILENHGYMLANALIKKHKKNLGDLIEEKQAWPRLSVPNGEWFGDNAEDRMRAEDRIRTALRSSHRRISVRPFISRPFERPLEAEA